MAWLALNNVGLHSRVRIAWLPTDSAQSRCPICFDPWTASGEHRIVSLACGHLFGKVRCGGSGDGDANAFVLDGISRQLPVVVFRAASWSG